MESPNTFQKYSKHRLSKLGTMNSIRLHQLLQSSQYAVLYALLGAFFGTIVEHIMPQYDPDSKPSLMIWEVVGQSVLISIVIFYVRKIVKVIPYIFNNDSNFVPYQKEYAVPEYQGDIVLFIAFIATQSNYLKRLKHLKLWLGEKMLGQENNELNEDVNANQVSNEQGEAASAGVTQTTGGGMIRTSAPPSPPVRNQGPALPPNFQSQNQLQQQPSQLRGQTPIAQLQQPSQTMAQQNPSNYFTSQPTNPDSSAPFQSQVNLDSSVGGGEVPDNTLTGNGFAPMTSGSMDYSFVDFGESNGYDMQSGNMFV